MSDSILSLPLELQVALAGGYLAHTVAFAGLRKQTGAAELALRSLAFGLAALLTLRSAQDAELPTVVSVLLALLIATALGAFWRRFGQRWSLKILSVLGISREDGSPDAWAALIQQPNLTVGQLSVHTKDGRILYQNSHSFDQAHLNGMYFGNDGSIVMVVEEEELPDGTEEQRSGITDANWGTRVTFIPADQIARVNIR